MPYNEWTGLWEEDFVPIIPPSLPYAPYGLDEWGNPLPAPPPPNQGVAIDPASYTQFPWTDPISAAPAIDYTAIVQQFYQALEADRQWAAANENPIPDAGSTSEYIDYFDTYTAPYVDQFMNGTWYTPEMQMALGRSEFNSMGLEGLLLDTAPLNNNMALPPNAAGAYFPSANVINFGTSIPTGDYPFVPIHEGLHALEANVPDSIEREIQTLANTYEAPYNYVEHPENYGSYGQSQAFRDQIPMHQGFTAYADSSMMYDSYNWPPEIVAYLKTLTPSVAAMVVENYNKGLR